uniref:JmjC domain-containing protein n=1 Tax=Kalanchoe fedtschenkoi TaxID=63787 RepID=A0A7N0TUM9_KALFE
MEESLRVRRLDVIPSPEDFASQIESRNIPAVFRGCVKDWEAFSKWNPTCGGLDYLQDLVGSALVEAMLSRSAPVFYGDIRRHERVPIPFRDFISSCKQRLLEKQAEQDDCTEMESKKSTEASTHQFEDVRDQIYLAQVPLVNTDSDDRVQLAALYADIQMPVFLQTKELASINMWMNNARSRSSSHYDPHHNLLCIVAGYKQVFLWPPSASSMLYPMPLYGEASNHSSLALEEPDFVIHPRAVRLMEYSEKVTLQAGDALFIPEGWYHQVDSGELTIAINFWWSSVVMSSMPEHMDAYYLRRILRRLTDKEMDKVLSRVADNMKMRHNGNSGNQGGEIKRNKQNAEGNQDGEIKRNKQNAEGLLQDLDPVTIDAIHKLVSLVHDLVPVMDQSPKKPFNSSTDSSTKVALPPSCLEGDPVAKIFGSLDPLHLQNVFLTMASKFPRTLEALILHLLTPLGAEVLTRKFDEMDLEASEEERNVFYQAFYGVFDDVNAAMDVILTMKESFSHQAFKNVFDQYLGVSIEALK